ncbi:hypothetical protein QDR37_07135 [Amnibacterium sp. CER49]|uniref:hypothetical protein n=1 Tax=Amnibacterium sp. CER49 TaxID=3039161 RepID=UPI00244A7F82|nr:hypothetical protein [Amnibacterium sp. CER49]MDH2443714.1 hypothetical protein [Amnibacterium sp. CER49]
MRLELDGIGVGDEATPVLAPLTAVLTDDAPAVVAVDGERGPVVASLLAAGRMRADRGRVVLDGEDDPAAVRLAVALVDTPVVAEPPAVLPVGDVVREELRFAGLRASRSDAVAVLADLGLERWYRAPIADLPGADRVRLLLALAAARPGVRALVLTAPERHGVAAADWLALAAATTEQGVPVLVIGGAALADHATALRLPADPEDR